MWAVCGGFFITNFILCNYLKVLVQPVFEKPVDSSEDVVTRGLIPYMHPGTGVWKKVMAKMPDPYPVLAETMIISTSWPQFFNLSKYNTIEKESRIFHQIIDNSHFYHLYLYQWQGTHAQMTYFYSLREEERKWAEESGTAWYRSKHPASISYPFVGQGYLSNKKWPLLKVEILLILKVRSFSAVDISRLCRPISWECSRYYY